MAPDRRLVDQHQVDLASNLCQAAIDYTEQKLRRNMSALRPGAVPTSHLRELQRRLLVLRDVIERLQDS